MTHSAISFEATGTSWSVRTQQPVSAALRSSLLERVALFEQQFSRFRDDSLVTEMADRAGVFQFIDEAAPMFALYAQLETMSDGAFSPLVAKQLVAAGYDTDYSFAPTKLSGVARLADLIEFESSKVKTSEPVQLDFGAAAKGLLVDIVAKMLLEAGHTHVVVNAGGDIYTSEPRAIHLEHPLLQGKSIGSIELPANSAIAASSSNRRNWGDFHHIINTQTKESPRDILATWVVADSAMTADMLATALWLFDEPPTLETLRKLDGLQHSRLEYAIMYANGRLLRTRGFNAKITS